MHKVIFFIVLFFLVHMALKVNAQCDQAFIDKCADNGENVKYVKHFRIRFEESKSEKKRSEMSFSVMLNKGNHYRFITCNDPSKPGITIIELSDDFGNFGGNYNGQTDKEYKAFDFLCTKTGPYYLKMFFKDGKAGCGVCVMALVVD